MSELAAEAQFLSPGFRTPFMRYQEMDDDMNMEITTAFENNCNLEDEDHRL